MYRIKNSFQIIILWSSLLILLILGILLLPKIMQFIYQNQAGYLLSSIQATSPQIDLDAIPCANSIILDQDERTKVADAIKALRLSIRWHKSASQSYLLLGNAYCLLGQPVDAITAYKQFAALRPNNPLGKIGLGFAYAELFLANGYMDSTLREFARQEWQASGFSIQDFLQISENFLQKGNYTAAGEWQARAAVLSEMDPKVISPPLGPNAVLVSSMFTQEEWTPCAWCQNAPGSYSIDRGLLQISYPSTQGASKGYAILTRLSVPLDSLHTFAIRLKGDPETNFCVEIVTDKGRTRLIDRRPLPIDWTIWSIKIDGKQLNEILIGISSQKISSKLAHQVQIDWIAVDK